MTEDMVGERCGDIAFAPGSLEGGVRINWARKVVWLCL